MSGPGSNADKEDLQIAVTMLRALRGWSQADLAQAAGLGASAISRYESGVQEPNPRTFDRIVTAVGLRPPLVRSLLTWIHKARAEVLNGVLRDPLDDMIEAGAMELAEAFSAFLRSTVADLEASENFVRPDHRTVEELWANLQETPVEHWQALIEAIDEFQTWEFCAFLCDKSREAATDGNGAEALQRARLAVRSAEMTLKPRPRVKGYALAQLAAALQASGDLGAAEEAMQYARTLWDAGNPREYPLLEEERLVEIESALLAERSKA